eukprot:7745569-Prorocentrum_lima.AAC.1
MVWRNMVWRNFGHDTTPPRYMVSCGQDPPGSRSKGPIHSAKILQWMDCLITSSREHSRMIQ